MLARAVGRVCNTVEMRHTGQILACALEDVLMVVELIAAHENIDLDAAVAAKFNATSEKVGLQTRLAA
jgi:hypothetical protein